MKIVELNEKSRQNVLENLLKRSPAQYEEYSAVVAEILENVRINKDKALFEYTEKFDKVSITKDTIRITQEEIEEAYSQVEPSLIDVIRKAIKNIEDYHVKQKRYSWFDTT
ncbi:MAG: histidinol dehydrogenase, partial [Clostridiales bacterium]|nr:histidinol dehydrogenase [Clostridiales bacterium]